MNSLPRFQKSEPGRFDFRLPDGLGHFVFPDWEDPEFKVEFHDAQGQLRFTATTTSEPPLSQGNDYDPTHHPEGGPFVSVDGIDLSSFALGLCEAWVYARVMNVPVLPYPTVLSAFEVVADLAAGPFYTTVERVRAEVPGTWPAEITEEMILLAIADASRKIDATLATCYELPFPDINQDPPTPALIESVCRKLASHQCLAWMGRLNAAEEAKKNESVLAELLWLVPDRDRPAVVRLPGYAGPLATYAGELYRGDEAEEAGW